ncbi:hypothetical protein SLS62_003272 [Diatrype stigma]|uniref:Heterokaryon incompatibility domain-containing protein n=1 Tax=Diatrype stigma TaxID=117547 RepID=A0AAN9YUE6_9PEZI
MNKELNSHQKRNRTDFPLVIKKAISKIVEVACCIRISTDEEYNHVSLQIEPERRQESNTSLAKRLCASCSRLRLSSIRPGEILYFSAVYVPNQLGCNLCQLVQGLYAEHLKFRRERLVEKPNTTPQNTNRPRAISIEILKWLENPSTFHWLDDVLVFEAHVSDTWFGNPGTSQLFLRNRHSTNLSNPRNSDASRYGSADVPAHGAFSPWADLALARLWALECVHRHPDCHSIVSGTPENETLHPMTRFIDVKLWRLVQLDEIFCGTPLEYVALSYVWGQDYQLRTLSSNLGLFRAHLPKANAPSDERLPRTIEDAIQVTKALGHRFLWVDALCIVQDSDEDLSRQLAQMNAIYGLAVITIAARSSSSSDSGLHGVSAPRSRVGGSDAEQVVNDEISVGVWDLGPGEERFEEQSGTLADKRYYMWRGWTFQEQILSTRTLEFNLDRMVFWYGKNASYQERGYPSFANTDMYNPHHFRYAVRKRQRQEKLSPDSISPDAVADDGWLLARWNTIRTAYSTRSLSYYIDRRRAISGTAKMMNDVIGGVDGDGLMRNNLHAEVIWYLDIKETDAEGVKLPADQAPNGLFPSWSWLDLWPITWPALCEPLPEVSICIVNNADSGNNSALEIEAAMVELLLTEGPDDNTKQLVYPDGNAANIKLRLDTMLLEAGMNITCVPIARAISVMWWDQELLLLRRERQHYVRVGMGSIPEHKMEVFDSYIHSGKAQTKRILCL